MMTKTRTAAARIEDGTFVAGQAVTYKGRPATFVSATLKHREIVQDGRTKFVVAFRVKEAK